MSYPIKYDFYRRLRGDTFMGVRFELFDGNDEPVDLSECSAKMQLRRTPGNTVVFEWDSSVGTIDISGNQVSVNEVIMEIPDYDYLYDLQITYLDGIVVTIATGLFKLKTDITR